ncbi:MAG: hypothetical protein P1Q69_07010 [Candidatus Thorarchaeota archaeon]|nr:hypothetical protein [Candidatus Thorarchaeota archaeon]
MTKDIPMPITIVMNRFGHLHVFIGFPELTNSSDNPQRILPNGVKVDADVYVQFDVDVVIEDYIPKEYHPIELGDVIEIPFDPCFFDFDKYRELKQLYHIYPFEVWYDVIEEKAQVWGVTYPEESSIMRKRFNKFYVEKFKRKKIPLNYLIRYDVNAWVMGDRVLCADGIDPTVRFVDSMSVRHDNLQDTVNLIRNGYIELPIYDPEFDEEIMKLRIKEYPTLRMSPLYTMTDDDILSSGLVEYIHPIFWGYLQIGNMEYDFGAGKWKFTRIIHEFAREVNGYGFARIINVGSYTVEHVLLSEGADKLNRLWAYFAPLEEEEGALL